MHFLNLAYFSKFQLNKSLIQNKKIFSAEFLYLDDLIEPKLWPQRVFDFSKKLAKTTLFMHSRIHITSLNTLDNVKTDPFPVTKI